MKWNDPEKHARLDMAEAEKKSRPRRPWRDGAYGWLRGRVSVKAMNVVICAVAAAIVVALILGVTMGQ